MPCLSIPQGSGASGDKVTRMNCPKCNSLNSDDAQWCSLCLTRFEQTSAVPKILPADPAEVEQAWALVAEDPSKVPGGPELSAGPVRKRGETLTWVCPSCETENGIDDQTCRTCGTSFYAAFMPAAVEPKRPQAVRNPLAAGVLSLIPGVGHLYVGSSAEGMARIFLGLWWIGSSLLLPSGGAALLGVKVVYILASIGLISVSALDAYRYARTPGIPAVLSSRGLLYASLALLVVLMAGGLLATFTAL